MGNSGFRKIFFQGNIVETPYKSFYDISFVDIEKNEESLNEFKGKPTLIVNTASKSEEDLERLKNLKQLLTNNGKVHLLLLPSNSFQNEQKSYKQILKTYKEIFGDTKDYKIAQKVEVNGKFQHQIYKFLKRNTAELYNKELCQDKNITEDFCKFLVDQNGVPVSYYSKSTSISEIMNDIDKLYINQS